MIIDPASAASISGSTDVFTLSNIGTTGLVTLTFYTKLVDHPNFNVVTETIVLDVVKLNQNISSPSSPIIYLYYNDNPDLYIKCLIGFWSSCKLRFKSTLSLPQQRLVQMS